MTKCTELLGKYAVAKTAFGTIHGEGTVIRLSNGPQVHIEREDGSKFWWSVRLCEFQDTLYKGPEVKRVRAEIFRLAKSAPNLEVMHWYMWLDECFENEEFHKEDFASVQWRSSALLAKGEPINRLLSMITPILEKVGCLSE